MSASAKMTPEAIRIWKARLDFASACIELENVDAADDPVRQRALAEALAMEARSRHWLPEPDRTRMAGLLNEFKSRRSGRLPASV